MLLLYTPWKHQKTLKFSDVFRGYTKATPRCNGLMFFDNFIDSVRGLDYYASNRSSHRRCSVRKGVLRNFAKFTGKHLCQSLFFNKVAGTSVFLWILRNFWEHFFYRTPADDCFLSNFFSLEQFSDKHWLVIFR